MLIIIIIITDESAIGRVRVWDSTVGWNKGTGVLNLKPVYYYSLKTIPSERGRVNQFTFLNNMVYIVVESTFLIR